MTNPIDPNQFHDKAESLYDSHGNNVQVERHGGRILLYAWYITEDSLGRPCENHPDTLNLTRRQAIEVARRLFITATE